MLLGGETGAVKNLSSPPKSFGGETASSSLLVVSRAIVATDGSSDGSSVMPSVSTSLLDGLVGK